MKRLQMKYNCIQFLYWITNCTIFGYVAIFLQYKGLSNTEIGIVTAMGSIMMHGTIYRIIILEYLCCSILITIRNGLCKNG